MLILAGCHGFWLPCNDNIVTPGRRFEPIMTEESAAWKPRRKPYIPSWSQGGGSNIYREQQSEYNAYAKQQEDATRDPAPTVSVSTTWAHVIERACAPVHYLCVSDATDGHAAEGAEDGRALRADGRDLKVLVVSSRFSGMRGPARQQIVNAVLADSFKSGALHSLQMRCWTPEEWVAKGSPADLGAPCSYSSTDNAAVAGQSLKLPGCTDDADRIPIRSTSGLNRCTE